jgi:hypothetical protein
MKFFATALSGIGEWGRWWSDLNNVQCKSIGNWHNESPLYNEDVLIKILKIK